MLCKELCRILPNISDAKGKKDFVKILGFGSKNPFHHVADDAFLEGIGFEFFDSFLKFVRKAELEFKEDGVDGALLFAGFQDLFKLHPAS